MVLKIVRYLAQQGYGTERLVVLTSYLGQLSKLQDVLDGDNDPVLNDLDSHNLTRAGLVPSADKTSKKRIRLATIGIYLQLNLAHMLYYLNRLLPGRRV
jgi:hypothetical protein